MNSLRNLASVSLASIMAITGLLALSSCNGGSSGNSTSQTSQQQVGQGVGQGTVKMFITDAETDRFNQILVTITGITLIASDGTKQVVSTDTITVDLRKITDFSQFLAQNGVQAGTYDKIRLDVSGIVLNQVDSNGNIIDTQAVKLPSGKIDLNPQQSITIAEDGLQTLEMDFDAKNSFKLTTTGNGKVIFRPVVFVHELGEHESLPGRLVREHGAITSPDLQADTFQLCSMDHETTHDCLNVVFDDTTAMYDSNLSAITPDGLVENTEVTVFGHLVKDTNGLHVQATTLVLGPEGTLLTEGGLVSTAPDSNGMMTVNIRVGQDIPAGDTSVQLLPAVQIVSRSTGMALTESDLVAGTPVIVVGQFDSATSVFNAVTVSVDDHTDEVNGTVTAVDTAAATGITTLTVSTSSGDQCVDVSDSTHIAMHSDNEGDDTVDGGTPASIAVGQTISASGTIGSDQCLSADSLVVGG